MGSHGGENKINPAKAEIDSGGRRLRTPGCLACTGRPAGRALWGAGSGG